MDAFNDPTVKAVVVMSSAQVAKTTIIENVTGYFIHHDPSPILLMQPTLEMAETFSKDRLAPMIRDTPALRERVAEAGSKKSGNTLLHKTFPMGHLTIVGANSPSSLASRPIRLLLGDEIDRYPFSVGTEGNPIRLAEKRTTAWWNAKRGYFSTPTEAGASEIDRLFSESDQRKFQVPCPHCGEFHVLLRENMKWREAAPITGKDGVQIRRAAEAWMECPGCNGRIGDVDRWRAIQRGEWQATAPFTGVAGFWLWQAYSPFKTLLDTVNEYLSAIGRPEEERTVVNTVFGEPYQQGGDAPDWERIAGRRGEYKRGTVPMGGLILTAGADVQKDRIEVQVKAWGRGKQAWLVDYHVLDGDTSREDVWQALSSLLSQSYRHESGLEMPISKLAIDSGYATSEVYRWARQFPADRVIVIKGYDTGAALVGSPVAAEVNRKGKRVKRGVRVWPVNVSMAKSELYGWLGMQRPESGDFPPGWQFFPVDIQDEFFRQLVAEQVRYRTVKGFRKAEWVKTRERNEALDTHNGARAAAELCGISRWTESHWRALEQHIYGDARPSQAVEPETATVKENLTVQNAAVVAPANRMAYARPRFRSTFLRG